MCFKIIEECRFCLKTPSRTAFDHPRVIACKIEVEAAKERSRCETVPATPSSNNLTEESDEATEQELGAPAPKKRQRSNYRKRYSAFGRPYDEGPYGKEFEGIPPHKGKCGGRTYPVTSIKVRVTCYRCHQLCADTEMLLTDDDIRLAQRPAYKNASTYFHGMHLDAVYTANKYGLPEVCDMLSKKKPLMEWVPVEGDTTIDKRLHFSNRETTNLYWGAMEKMNWKKKRASEKDRTKRYELRALMNIRKTLLEKYWDCSAAVFLEEYKVLVNPEEAPLEHVKAAFSRASLGTRRGKNVNIRDILAREEEFKTFKVRLQAPLRYGTVEPWVDELLRCDYQGMLRFLSRSKTPESISLMLRLRNTGMYSAIV
jgi:hypothetical protein